MKIRELFEKDVTRDIPPVVYFHEQDPKKLRDEVDEYIVTGGFPAGDPRARRVEHGIHEGFVNLLAGMLAEFEKKGGPELPAIWISGFYGSGKSSFAKLLGLALDGATLDDGTPLSQALLRRDDSPRRHEFVDAWKRLLAKLEPIAVVFDIGAVARDNEQIHSAALRQIQARLGYCTKSSLVAQWELKFERDEVWNDFLKAAEKTLGKPWDKAKLEEQAEDHFSHVLHVMSPDRYTTPTDWIDSHAGQLGEVGTSVEETIKAIEAMLALRAVGKALFIVIDEVSQYVHQDDTRMLKLQSFVSDLGKRLKGAAWIVATGQQKLEDTSDNINIGKLKDRFPPRLRVHLGATNIRDVVHKRLLKKKADQEKVLRDLLDRHRSDLKLHGYSCEAITEEDFVEVYPMLPGHVDLLLQITSNMRLRSSRVQGDDHAIRGLLQLLGELFRSQALADREVGDLLTIDAIYEVQQSALDPDVQTALARIFDHDQFRNDELAQRAAKAVALLELIQETTPTTPELVAKCLYSRLGLGNQTQAVGEALERLRQANLLGYSEKQGYKVQSSAGQEWERERRDVPATSDTRSQIVQDKLKELVGKPDRPRWKSNNFPWAAWYSDGRAVQDARIQELRGGAGVSVDFRFLSNKEDRAGAAWVQKSDQESLRDRLVWVVGDPGRIGEIARELHQSRYMIKRYEVRRESLPREKQRLLIEEQSRVEELETRMADAVAEAFFDGTIYFRGQPLKPADFGGAFATALTEVARQKLPDLYPHFTEIAVTDTELNQLLEPTLSGPSNKFMDSGLGLLSLDAGKYVATCQGQVPTRVMEFLERAGASGSTIVNHFQKPPYGYPPDVVKACLAGLLRAGKIRIRPDDGPEITSVRDPGTKDLFRRERDLGKAEILPSRDSEVEARDRVAICKMFESSFGVQLDRENDAIADAVFAQFPGKVVALRDVGGRLNQLPGRPELPQALQRLQSAIEECTRDRQVERIVKATKRNLDALRDGFEQLGILRSDLADEAIAAVRAAAEVRDHQLSQLKAARSAGEITEHARAIENQLKSERPWRGVESIAAAVEAVRRHYTETRHGLLTQQARKVENTTAKLKARDGFEKLTADQVHRVLKPLGDVVQSASADALYPALVELRDSFATRLSDAETQAHDLLDEELARQTKTDVVKVQLGLHGRELANRAQLDALLKELDERLAPPLAEGKRVRIV